MLRSVTLRCSAERPSLEGRRPRCRVYPTSACLLRKWAKADLQCPFILRGSRSLPSGRAARGPVGSHLRMTARVDACGTDHEKSTAKLIPARSRAFIIRIVLSALRASSRDVAMAGQDAASCARGLVTPLRGGFRASTRAVLRPLCKVLATGPDWFRRLRRRDKPMRRTGVERTTDRAENPATRGPEPRNAAAVRREARTPLLLFAKAARCTPRLASVAK